MCDRITAQIGARAGDNDCDGSFVAENYEILREARLIALTGDMQIAFWTAEIAINTMIVTAQSAGSGLETMSAVITGWTVVGRGAIRTVELAMKVAGAAAFCRRQRSNGLSAAYRADAFIAAGVGAEEVEWAVGAGTRC